MPALQLALDGAISGLRVIRGAQALLAREDRALAIVCPPGPVRRLFNKAGIADRLLLYASPEEAATALVPADFAATPVLRANEQAHGGHGRVRSKRG